MKTKIPVLCKENLCAKNSVCRGYCPEHYNKLLFLGEFDSDSTAKCVVANCTDRIKGRADGKFPLCSKHYAQWDRANNSKTRDSDKLRKIRDKKTVDITKTIYRKSISGRWARLKSHCKKRGKELALTKEQYFAIVTPDKCHYCPGKLNTGGYSLDKIDNTKIYELGNVVPCCWKCNNLKGDYLTVEETVEIVKLLKKIRNKENIWE